MISLKKTFFYVTAFYLLLTALCAVPFALSGELTDPADLLFDSVSAASSTGASVIAKPEELPLFLLLWRALIQWLGSLSMLLFSLVFFTNIGLSGSDIGSIESSNYRPMKLTPKKKRFAVFILTFYMTASLIAFALLKFCGLSLLDSAIYALSSISTGGFGTRAVFDGALSRPPVLLILMFSMLLGSLDFAMLYSIYRDGGGRAVRRDSEAKSLLATVNLAAVLIFPVFRLMPALGAADKSDFGEILFQCVSFATTTGYSLGEYPLWPVFGKLILFGLMFCGACSNSAGGGLKEVRAVTVWKYIRRNLSFRLHPNAVFSTRLSERSLPTDNISAIVAFTFLYITTYISGVLLLAAFGNGIEESVSASLACLSNCGAYFGPGGGLYYGAFSGASKLLLSFLMMAGRLELFSFLLLFTATYWRKDR